MIKLRTLRWEIILGHPGGPNVITKVLIRRRQAVREKRTFYDAGFEDTGGAKKCSQPLEGGKGKETFSLRAPRRNAELWTEFDF